MKCSESTGGMFPACYVTLLKTNTCHLKVRDHFNRTWIIFSAIKNSAFVRNFREEKNGKNPPAKLTTKTIWKALLSRWFSQLPRLVCGSRCLQAIRAHSPERWLELGMAILVKSVCWLVNQQKASTEWIYFNRFGGFVALVLKISYLLYIK